MPAFVARYRAATSLLALIGYVWVRPQAVLSSMEEEKSSLQVQLDESKAELRRLKEFISVRGGSRSTTTLDQCSMWVHGW